MLPCGTSPMVWYSKRTVVYIIFWDHKQESEQEVFNTWEEQPMIAAGQMGQLWSYRPSFVT